MQASLLRDLLDEVQRVRLLLQAGRDSMENGLVLVFEDDRLSVELQGAVCLLSRVTHFASLLGCPSPLLHGLECPVDLVLLVRQLLLEHILAVTQLLQSELYSLLVFLELIQPPLVLVVLLLDLIQCPLLLEQLLVGGTHLFLQLLLLVRLSVHRRVRLFEVVFESVIALEEVSQGVLEGADFLLLSPYLCVQLVSLSLQLLLLLGGFDDEVGL
mmetsp:Transcript_35387/g.87945  ORF Transcript_35387/g.87945 Transcript_35387/m.87945 type:complete len:214 (+) Transcript_35387:2264-2905(+)